MNNDQFWKWILATFLTFIVVFILIVYPLHLAFAIPIGETSVIYGIFAALHFVLLPFFYSTRPTAKNIYGQPGRRLIVGIAESSFITFSIFIYIEMRHGKTISQALSLKWDSPFIDLLLAFLTTLIFAVIFWKPYLKLAREFDAKHTTELSNKPNK